jgi:hypothetical protein
VSDNVSAPAPPITYRVTSLGLSLPAPGGRGRERHIPPGGTITRADLLAVTRPRYIEAMLRLGDLEVVPDADPAAR